MSTPTTITVYHAQDRDAFQPFGPATKIKAVFQYTRPDVDPAAPGDTLEDAYALFNMDQDMIRHTGPGDTCSVDPLGCVDVSCPRFTADSYRNGRNRSLSVGDVLVIGGPAGTTLPNGTGPGEVAYAVASFGFDQVTVDLAQIIPLEDHQPAPEFSRLGFTVQASELSNDWRPSTHAARLGLAAPSVADGPLAGYCGGEQADLDEAPVFWPGEGVTGRG